jgi:hypothetical protein
LQQFYDDATKAGVVMSQDDLAASKNLSIAQAQLGEAFKGLAITVGREFIPALTSAVQVVTNFLEIVRPVFDLLTPFADALQATADGTAAMTGATNENTSALKSNLLTQQQVIALHQKGEATSADYAAKWAQLTQQVNEGKITQDEANAAYDRFTSATTHATLATEDSTTAIERHTAALVKDVKAQEANRLEQLKTAGGLLGLTASLQQTQQDQAALNKLQEQGKQKTQAYRDAVVQATTDQLSFRTAVRQFFADNPDVKLGVMRDTLRQMAAQAGVSASQFKSALGPALDNIIGKVTNLRDKTQAPFMVTFSVDTSNLESAAARAMQLKRQLAHGL